MLHPLILIVAAVFFVAGFIFPPLAGYRAAHTSVVAALFVYCILLPRYWDVFGLWPVRMVGLALAAILFTIPFVYQHDGDLFILVALLPLFVAPAVVIILREEPRFASPATIGFLCLGGAFGAFGVALDDIYLLNISRAGGGNNPIHFAGLTAILGYGSLVGLYGNKSNWRFALFLGPIFATFAIGYSGSRGPMLASLIMALIAFPFVFALFWRRSHRSALTLLGGAIIVVGVAGFIAFNDPRARSIVDQVTGVVAQTENIDGSTQQRLAMYRSAFEAFKRAPVLGHGSGQIVESTDPFMPKTLAHIRRSEHLHNDIADFAVASGTFGIAAYVLLLLAPFAAVWQTADKAMRQCVLFGACTLSCGYLALGMTNAVFGLLPQTVLYGLLVGVLAAFSQQRLDA